MSIKINNNKNQNKTDSKVNVISFFILFKKIILINILFILFIY